MKIDIGDLCTHCGRDTSLGSGNLLFVNRIPSGGDGQLLLVGGDDVTIDVETVGYMCVECQLIECGICNKMVLDYELDGEVICMDCYYYPCDNVYLRRQAND